MKTLSTVAAAQKARRRYAISMTHQKLVSPLATCILIALFATPVFAHDGVVHEDEVEAEAHLKANGPLPLKPLDLIKRAKEVKDNIPGVKVDFRADADAKVRTGDKPREHATGTPFQGLKNLIKMHGGAIKNRFRLAIAHMNNILDRIETRLGKLADAGVDVSSATQLKVKAETAVAKAEVDAKAVADFVETASDSTDRAAFKAELETKLRTAHQSVKAAHAAVMKAVRALVALGKDAKIKVDADASVETTVQ